jgi:hypothetical protein
VSRPATTLPRRGLARRGRTGPAPRACRRPALETLEDRNLLSAASPWTPLVNQAPDYAGTMMLLSDGRVMVQGYVPGNDWMTLSPDASGSYVKGTWSTIAPMSTTRLYYASNVLPSGKVFLLGGEYSDFNYDINWTNTGEIYDPVANAWSSIATFPDPSGHFGDDPSMLLSNGKDVLLGGGAYEGGITYVYHSDTNTYSAPIFKVYNDSSDEETWVKLQDGRVLTYDIFASIFINGGNNAGFAEVFDPTTNKWSSISPADGTANGAIPALSNPFVGYELGPSMLLQDGRVFVLGATGHTAFYNPSTNTWSAGPDIIDNSGTLFGADDVPAAELPNGHVIFTADNVPQSGYGPSQPTELFEFDPSANTISQIPAPDPQLQGIPAYPTRLLVLPNGQLLFDDSDTQLWAYTPVTQAAPQYRPVVNNVTYNGGGVFTLTGTQLNGPSSGSSYGDDVESDENYPIVRLTRFGTGDVHYARTFNWSSTGVATGSTPETVNFTLPAGMLPGRYSLVESGAGVSSDPIYITITGFEVGPPGQTGTAALTPPGVGKAASVAAGTVTVRGSVNPDLAGVSLALVSHSGLFNFPAQVRLDPAPDAGAAPTDFAAATAALAPAQAAAVVTSYDSHADSAKVTDALFSTGLDETPSAS